MSSFIFITVRKVDTTSSPGLARIEQLCHDVFDLGVSSLHFLGEVACVYFIDVRPIDPKFFAVTCYCYDTVHLASPLVLLLRIILHLVAPKCGRYLCILRIEQTNAGPVCSLSSLRCRPTASRRRGPSKKTKAADAPRLSERNKIPFYRPLWPRTDLFDRFTEIALQHCYTAVTSSEGLQEYPHWP